MLELFAAGFSEVSSGCWNKFEAAFSVRKRFLLLLIDRCEIEPFLKSHVTKSAKLDIVGFLRRFVLKISLFSGLM